MKRIIMFMLCLCLSFASFAQDFPFVPDTLKLITKQQLFSKPPPSQMDHVFYEDGSKAELNDVIPMFMQGSAEPRMYVDQQGNYIVLVAERMDITETLAKTYDFIPDSLTLISMKELMEKGPPQYLEYVFNEDGSRTTLQKVMPQISQGTLIPKMYVDSKGNYRALVVEEKK